MKCLITGGAGFIGSHFIRYLLNKYPHYHVINLDLLTYAGNLENLRELQSHPHYRFVKGDICDRRLIESLQPVDVIVNFAAGSHVDRSIADPDIFVRSNVQGVQVLLDVARRHGIKKFVQVSTDEVYGSLGDSGYFSEETPLAPNSPYSASKAAADLLVRAYYQTYGLPVMITRCSNNYGPNQFPEKLIPLIITHALADKEIPVYGDGGNVRDWLHVYDHCAAIDLVIHRGIHGSVYNVGGSNEWTNLAIVRKILSLLQKPERLIRFVEDRPGHDRRYAIDAAKIRRELGWKPHYDFATGIAETIQWYINNREWWLGIKSMADQPLQGGNGGMTRQMRAGDAKR
ncbi:dTDP-glucose 4,6-dehydratase [Brevibacillus humidisoli]|uniref:dTDP-glucose 4,6-dehydratase n=1 Tax=Brevibacillus humidisoli TaxID=2895522 RepID=UPI001E30B112|nr:dTDP-glucose 4,6-dehydratase [Brevibacillus humidisoli]UFJ42536.1 dTDP-glucose 4,6-dehydratase [Brevibacillus humidisoli]